jgi:putative endonuclease
LPPHLRYVILSAAQRIEGPLILSSNHSYWIYMMSNKTRSTLYIAVTDGLERRVAQHQAGEIPGLTQQYHCVYLVYFEHFRNVRAAIAREKRLKGWRREKKNALIAKNHPHWNDLAVDFYGPAL